MKVAGVILFCLLIELESFYAITVKPTGSNNAPEKSHSEIKRSPQLSDEDRIRYIPFMDVRHQLDNLNLVRYLQSLPKTTTEIPSIAFLYGSAIKRTPHIQSGFIYKARTPENGNNKDSFPSATMYPIFNRQVPPDHHHHPLLKYHQLYNQKPSSIPFSKVKNFTPFLPTNKIPGAWQPINHHIYKPHYIKGQVIDAIISNHNNHEINNDYLSHISLTTTPTVESVEEDFIPITNHHHHHQYKHVPTTTPSSSKFTKHYLKSDTKSITILNPESHSHSVDIYEHSDKSLYDPTTTAKSIEITSDQPTQQQQQQHHHPIDSYEFEEQIIYELHPHFANNKSTPSNDDDEQQRQQQHEYNNPHHSIEHEELTTSTIVSTSPKHIKPHLNFTRITPVPNDLKIHHDKEHNNDDEIDYYDKHVDNDYDDVIIDGSRSPNQGRPGIDYPNYHKIPETAFSCKEQRYKGFFGDPETRCQVWHYCDLNGGKASFLCPNGTIFSQTALTCDWWFNVKCSSTAQLYVLNERLYKYILPFTPKFPQDFQGPLVDKYLALKFKEMEEEAALEKEKEENEAAAKEEEDQQETKQHHEQREEDEEKNVKVVPIEAVKIEETTDDNSIESSSSTPSTESTPSSIVTSTTIVYAHQQLAELEKAEVEIHNPGTSGLIGHHIDS